MTAAVLVFNTTKQHFSVGPTSFMFALASMDGDVYHRLTVDTGLYRGFDVAQRDPGKVRVAREYSDDVDQKLLDFVNISIELSTLKAAVSQDVASFSDTLQKVAPQSYELIEDKIIDLAPYQEIEKKVRGYTDVQRDGTVSVDDTAQSFAMYMQYASMTRTQMISGKNLGRLLWLPRLVPTTV